MGEERRRGGADNGSHKLDQEQEERVSCGASYGTILESAPGCEGRRIVNNPQQIRGGGDTETGSLLPGIVEVGDNVMKIIHEMNNRIYSLSGKTNSRQQQALEDLTSKLKEQMRGSKRSSDMVEDRVKG